MSDQNETIKLESLNPGSLDPGSSDLGSNTMEQNNPIKVKAKIIQGHFKWCGNYQANDLYNHIRIREQKDNEPSKKYLFLEFERQAEIDLYTVFKDLLGQSFDIRHTVDDNQTKMFFQINKYGTDRKDQPYYLFGQEWCERKFPESFLLKNQFNKYFLKIIESSRSLPIDVTEPVFITGESADCSSCSEGLDSNTCDTLHCGHAFHNDCLMDYLEVLSVIKPYTVTCPACGLKSW